MLRQSSVHPGSSLGEHFYRSFPSVLTTQEQKMMVFPSSTRVWITEAGIFAKQLVGTSVQIQIAVHGSVESSGTEDPDATGTDFAAIYTSPSLTAPGWRTFRNPDPRAPLVSLSQRTMVAPDSNLNFPLIRAAYHVGYQPCYLIRARLEKTAITTFNGHWWIKYKTFGLEDRPSQDLAP